MLGCNLVVQMVDNLAEMMEPMKDVMMVVKMDSMKAEMLDHVTDVLMVEMKDGSLDFLTVTQMVDMMAHYLGR